MKRHYFSFVCEERPVLPEAPGTTPVLELFSCITVYTVPLPSKVAHVEHGGSRNRYSSSLPNNLSSSLASGSFTLETPAMLHHTDLYCYCCIMYETSNVERLTSVLVTRGTCLLGAGREVECPAPSLILLCLHAALHTSDMLTLNAVMNLLSPAKTPTSSPFETYSSIIIPTKPFPQAVLFSPGVRHAFPNSSALF
jgi:hypothetical protein